MYLEELEVLKRDPLNAYLAEEFKFAAFIYKKIQLSPEGKAFVISSNEVQKNCMLNADDFVIMLEKFANDYKILSFSEHDIDGFISLTLFYNVLPKQAEFLSYFNKLVEKIRQLGSPHKSSKIEKKLIETNDAQIINKTIVSPSNIKPAYWITFNENSRDIILNDRFVISSPQFQSINYLIFDYLFHNPNKLVPKEFLEKEIVKSKINKSLHQVISELGFIGFLKDMFFKTNSVEIQFKPSVSEEEAQQHKVTTIRLNNITSNKQAQ